MSVNGVLTASFYNIPFLLAPESNEGGILLKLRLVLLIKGHWFALTFQFQICLCLIRGQQQNHYDKDFVLSYTCLLKLKSLWNGDDDST